jgi:hypothetical protein
MPFSSQLNPGLRGDSIGPLRPGAAHLLSAAQTGRAWKLRPLSITSSAGLLRKRTEDRMPEQKTIQRARRDRRQGKAPTTQAGEFVREEMEHIREGKHGARSTKQAIAIGLSKARRAGVKLPPPPRSAKSKTRKSAAYASRAGRRGATRTSPRRSRAVRRALKRESRSAASRKALARQARTAARRRSPSARRASARRAVRTKGPRVRRAAARKAARTRQRRRRAARAEIVK